MALSPLSFESPLAVKMNYKIETLLVKDEYQFGGFIVAFDWPGQMISAHASY